ncbi:hypothetical protein M434DRAFT_296651 [Hypoxylon sp. CO27-5]|nr:hypothetical protein M434DRAFT_296651 [Hypoxylon sp. CO27-5]
MYDQRVAAVEDSNQDLKCIGFSMSTCFPSILAYCIMISLMRIGFYVVSHSLKLVSSSRNGNSPNLTLDHPHHHHRCPPLLQVCPCILIIHVGR